MGFHFVSEHEKEAALAYKRNEKKFFKNQYIFVFVEFLLQVVPSTSLITFSSSPNLEIWH